MDAADGSREGDRGGESEKLIPRPPNEADLVALCRRLNGIGAEYFVVGGFAIIHAGYGRFTEDIDLLIETSAENEAKVFQALEFLPDQAVRQLDPGDVAKYSVVRVADEIVVDLMQSACGINYAEAFREISIREVEGVPIPFAPPRLLWRIKARTHPAKDAPDLVFLSDYFKARGELPPAV